MHTRPLPTDPAEPADIDGIRNHIGTLEPRQRDKLINELRKAYQRKGGAARQAIPALMTVAALGIVALIVQLVVFGMNWPNRAAEGTDKVREAVFDVINNVELLIPAIITAILAWLTYTLIKLTLEAIELARDESEVSRGTLLEVQKQTETTAAQAAAAKVQAAAAMKQAVTAADSLTEMTKQRLDAQKRDSLEHVPFIDLRLINVLPLERVAFRGDFSSHDVPFLTSTTVAKTSHESNILNSLVRPDDYLMTSRVRLSLKIKNAGMGPALQLRVKAQLLGYYTCVVSPYAAEPQSYGTIATRVLFGFDGRWNFRPQPEYPCEFPYFTMSADSWTMLPSGAEDALDIDIRAGWRLGGPDVNAIRNYTERRRMHKLSKPPLAVRITTTYAALDGSSSKTAYTVFIREDELRGKESEVDAEIVCFETVSDPAMITIEAPITSFPKSASDERPVTTYWDQHFESRDEERRLLQRTYELLRQLPLEIPIAAATSGVTDDVAQALIDRPESASQMDIAKALEMDPLIFRIVEHDRGLERFLQETGKKLDESLQQYVPRDELRRIEREEQERFDQEAAYYASPPPEAE